MLMLQNDGKTPFETKCLCNATKRTAEFDSRTQANGFELADFTKVVSLTSTLKTLKNVKKKAIRVKTDF